MPTYLYECTRHGEFEEVHSMSDHQPEWPCPKCNAWSRQLINFEGGVKGSESPWWIVGKGYASGTKENPDPGPEGTQSRGAFEVLKSRYHLTHPSQIDTRQKYRAYLKKWGMMEPG